MARSELLLLHHDQLDKRTERFFASLRASPENFGRFAADPAGQIAEALFEGKARLPPQEIDRANRLVFALLSNPRFLAWAQDYQRMVIREIGQRALAAPTRRDAKRTLFQMLGKRRIFLDFAKGMKEFGDEELFYAMGLKARDMDIGDGLQSVAESDSVAFLVQSVGFFVQTIFILDQGFVVHQTAVTENKADAHGVSHADVFFINDHVMFTTHDFFFDHSSHAQSETKASTDSNADSSSSSDADSSADSEADAQSAADSEADSEADSDAESEADAAGSDADSEADAAGSDSASEADAGSGTSSKADSGSDASSDAASDAAGASADNGSESSADHGSEADASAFMNLFGMSRWELQQFAAVVAQAVSLHANRLRATGALTASAPINNRLER